MACSSWNQLLHCYLKPLADLGTYLFVGLALDGDQ
jgi:hypothetical protein